MPAIGGHQPHGRKSATGVCPECREPKKLLVESGKVGLHGRSKANPSGCPGSYQPPYRAPRPGVAAGGTVVGFKPGDDGPTSQS